MEAHLKGIRGMMLFKVSWEELRHLKAASLPARDSVVVSRKPCGKLQDIVCVLKGQKPQAKHLGAKPVGGIVYVAWECALTFSALWVKKIKVLEKAWGSLTNSLLRNEACLWKASYGMYTAKSTKRASVDV